MASGGSPRLLLTGNLKLGADDTTAADVSCVVSAFKITGAREQVEIPAVLCSGEKSVRAGSATYQFGLDYFSDDTDATNLFMVLWDALDPASNPEGKLYFEGSFAPGVVSPTNPLWSGEFLVTGAAIGGTVGELMSDSQTYPMLARPTMASALTTREREESYAA